MISAGWHLWMVTGSSNALQLHACPREGFSTLGKGKPQLKVQTAQKRPAWKVPYPRQGWNPGLSRPTRRLCRSAVPAKPGGEGAGDVRADALEEGAVMLERITGRGLGFRNPGQGRTEAIVGMLATEKQEELDDQELVRYVEEGELRLQELLPLSWQWGASVAARHIGNIDNVANRLVLLRSLLAPDISAMDLLGMCPILLDVSEDSIQDTLQAIFMEADVQHDTVMVPEVLHHHLMDAHAQHDPVKDPEVQHHPGTDADVQRHLMGNGNVTNDEVQPHLAAADPNPTPPPSPLPYSPEGVAHGGADDGEQPGAPLPYLPQGVSHDNAANVEELGPPHPPNVSDGVSQERADDEEQSDAPSPPYVSERVAHEGDEDQEQPDAHAGTDGEERLGAPALDGEHETPSGEMDDGLGSADEASRLLLLRQMLPSGIDVLRLAEECPILTTAREEHVEQCFLQLLDDGFLEPELVSLLKKCPFVLEQMLRNLDPGLRESD